MTDKTVSACKEGHKKDCDMLSNVGIPSAQKDESYCTCGKSNPPTETNEAPVTVPHSSASADNTDYTPLQKQPNYTPTETESDKTLHLTNTIECDWCGAKPGEPCKIQPPVDYKGHPTDYFLGNDKTYFKQEVIHLCRAK